MADYQNPRLRRLIKTGLDTSVFNTLEESISRSELTYNFVISKDFELDEETSLEQGLTDLGINPGDKRTCINKENS